MAEKNTRKRTAEKQVSKVIAYKNTFGSQMGKLVLNDLMRTHHMLGTTMGKVKDDVIFKEGERNVILRILKILQTDPETLRQRIKEIENEHSE